MPGSKAAEYNESYITSPSYVRATVTTDPDFNTIPESIIVPGDQLGDRMGINRLFVYVRGCSPKDGEASLAIRCPITLPLANPDYAWCDTTHVHIALDGAIVVSPAPPGEYKVRFTG